MTKNTIYLLLVLLFSCNNSYNLKVKYEYQKETERKSKKINSNLLIILGGYFQNDFVEVLYENRLIFSEKITTNKSIYEAAEFNIKKPKTKYMYLKVRVNYRDYAQIKVQSKYNSARIDYFEREKYFYVALWYDIIPAI